MLNTQVDKIQTAGNRVYGVMYTNKRGFKRKAECRAVLLTTGGASYPATGSTGDGYHIASELGHTIVPVRPSLVALRSSHPKMKDLIGLRLKNIRASLEVDGDVAASEFGEIEFSTRGIDGPVILRMSRAGVDAIIDEKKVEVVLDLKPALTEEILRARIARELEDLDKQAFAIELLRKMLPRNLVYFVADSAGIHPKTHANKLTDEEIGRIITAMKRAVFPIVDYGTWEQAIVTAGGVSLDEVDPETMQSRIIKGLYFAGEVLDLDADTGGYNLQIAFSTGRLASQLRQADER
jgi:predicted Rossmann fold flavoprotein